MIKLVFLCFLNCQHHRRMIVTVGKLYFVMFGEVRHFSVRIRNVTEPDETLRTARTFSRQYITPCVCENQRMQAFCAYATFKHEAPGVVDKAGCVPVRGLYVLIQAPPILGFSSFWRAPR